MESSRFPPLEPVPSGPESQHSPQSSYVAWLQLVRFGNAVLSGVAASVGHYLSAAQTDAAGLVGSAMAPILITAAGNIDNDLCDQPIDARIKPERPLVTGAISAGSARRAMIGLHAVGLLAAASGGVSCLAIAALVILLLSLYNRRFSGLPLAGNAVIALLGALPIVYGAVYRSPSFDTWTLTVILAALTAFWLHLAREIVKDCLDREGDAAVGRRTLPIVWSTVAASRLGAVAMLLGAASAIWLGTTGTLGILYFFGVCVTVLPALLLGSLQCAFQPTESVLERWSAGLKLCMAAGLIWIVLGRMYP